MGIQTQKFRLIQRDSLGESLLFCMEGDSAVTKKELEKQIQELKDRVAALEASRYYVYIPQVPFVPYVSPIVSPIGGGVTLGTTSSSSQ